MSENGKLLGNHSRMNVFGFIDLCKWFGIRIPISINSCESEYSKGNKSGNINESEKIWLCLTLRRLVASFPSYKLLLYSLVRGYVGVRGVVICVEAAMKIISNETFSLSDTVSASKSRREPSVMTQKSFLT